MQAKKLLGVTLIAWSCVVMLGSGSVVAEEVRAAKVSKGKIFDENEFLRVFSGKTRQQVTEIIGQPVRREQSVKPSGADANLVQVPGTKKPINVEMWYYKNIVSYEKKKTYKTTELTFVNDRCANIAFFNDK